MQSWEVVHLPPATIGPLPRHHWGMIIPNIIHAIYPEILRGVEDVCSKSGVNLIVCNTDYDPDKQDQYIRKLIYSGVGGLIIMPAPVTLESFSSFELLQKHGIRFVFCGRGIEAFKAPKVVPNDFFGGFLATRHLLQMGWQRPAYLGGRLFTSSEQRYHGYLSAIDEYNLIVSEQF
jgi:DNA-binding LacI/PurR family transcriptional regulator